MDAFVTKNLTTPGIIAIQAYVLGLRKTIYIDDYLPFYTSSTTLVFAGKSDDGELWAPFLEKAWAKANGNYQSIVGGWPSESMRFITGAPSITVSVSSYNANDLFT